MAAAIVQKIAMSLNMLRHISIIVYGSAENAFTVAAGKVLSGENTENILIVIDGDKFTTSKEKRDQLKKVLTGTESNHNDKIEQALATINQFELPPNIAPEKYIHSLLITMNDSRECVVCAKNIISVSNSHDWIDNIVEQMGIGEQSAYSTILDVVTEHPAWGRYVSNVREWIMRKSEEV